MCANVWEVGVPLTVRKAARQGRHTFLVCTISLASIFADLMSPRLAASRTCFSAFFLSRSRSRICLSRTLCWDRMSACHFRTSSCAGVELPHLDIYFARVDELYIPQEVHRKNRLQKNCCYLWIRLLAKEVQKVCPLWKHPPRVYPSAVTLRCHRHQFAGHERFYRP